MTVPLEKYTMKFNYIILVFTLIMITSSIHHGNTSVVVGQLSEYCETQVFKAICDADQVIVMKAARYGRMQIGQCVRKDLGYIGCYTDVLQLADKKCSGRRQCEIRIPDPAFDSTRPCLEELKTYLEASYDCVKVHVPATNCVEQGGGVTISEKSGNLASITTLETLCGSETTPWVIEAKPGQLINVTFYDFNLASRDLLPYHLDSPSIAECQEYAYLLDPTARRKIKICPGRNRVTEVYVSLNHSLEVALRTRALTEKGYHFLLHYQIQGCADLTLPPDMYFKKLGDNDGIVGCTEVPNTWPVTCIDNNWLGKWDNCTRFSVVKTRTDESRRSHLSAVVVVGIICIVVIMMCTVFGVGGFCLRKYFQRRSPNHSYDMSYDCEDDREPFKPPEDTIINDLTRDPPPPPPGPGGAGHVKPPCPIHQQEQYAIVMQNKQNNCMRHMDGNDYSPIPQRTNLETELSLEPDQAFTTFTRAHSMPHGGHLLHHTLPCNLGQPQQLQHHPQQHSYGDHLDMMSPHEQGELVPHCYSHHHHNPQQHGAAFGGTMNPRSQSKGSLLRFGSKASKAPSSPNNRWKKNINKKMKSKPTAAKSQMEILHVPYPHSNHQQCLQNHLPNVVILDKVKSNPRYSVLYKLMEMNKEKERRETVQEEEERNNSNLNNTL